MIKLLPLFALLFLYACASADPEQEIVLADTDSIVAIQAATFGPIDTALHDSLRQIEERSGGLLGVAAIEIESGWRTSYRGTETFPMASVGKLPMAIQFMTLVDSGTHRLDSTVRLTRIDHRPGGSVLYHRVMRDSGGATSVHALLESMLVYSDNTASDYLLRLSGGPAPVDGFLRSRHLDAIDVTHNEGELIMLWAGLDPRRGDSTWTRDRIYAKIEEAGDSAWKYAEERMANDSSDAATPEQMTLLLVMLQKRELLSARSTDTILAILGRAATGKARIPALLPPGTRVAHKTGTISSTTNDVGIVTLPNGRHLAVSIFIKSSRVGVRARERAIADAAKLLYYSRVGR